ncbi:MAG: hypothetical protein J1E41_06580 [Ruminococcus sp.]|nr:hypothetical protein [Ruminococcus sp.]
MKAENKKKYIAPEFQFKIINFIEDVLSASNPGGGSWGYWDEDTQPTTEPSTDDFWDDEDDGFWDDDNNNDFWD